jgi:hypothetical protein
MHDSSRKSIESDCTADLPVHATNRLLHLLSGTGISFLVHITALVIMAFLVIPQAAVSERLAWVMHTEADVEIIEDAIQELATPIEIESLQSQTISEQASEQSVSLPAATDTAAYDTVMEQPHLDSLPNVVELGLAATHEPRMIRTIASSATKTGNLHDLRSNRTKHVFTVQTGPTPPSEKAVAEALKWIVTHQLPDGSWNFNHQAVQGCDRQCSEPGSLTDCTTGATGLALLPLLGAGQTHREGRYKKEVERGLYYLINRMKVQQNMGSLAEGGGNMYAHGICAIVLTEAYAMTRDKALRAPAQLALNYISYAQDPVGGGWRYREKQPGDTSVVGWQLMALKSGHLAYLDVNPQSIRGASRFLDSVQTAEGASYGYTDPGAAPATSAVGLLSRMYLGWKQENEHLQRGVQQLAKKGPSQTEMYYNYYATQALRHMGGEQWEKWNVTMRDSLVSSQSQTGHTHGSWHMRGDHGAEKGGRLYCTSLATMILEVYYRHLPIYGVQAAQEDFPL